MAADKMTGENPADAQMNTTINKKLLKPGTVAGGLTPHIPRSSNQMRSPAPPQLAGKPGIDLVTALIRPTLNGGLADTNRQMVPAPASEIAGGREIWGVARFFFFLPFGNQGAGGAETRVAAGARNAPRQRL